MGVNKDQLLEFIILPTLEYLSPEISVSGSAIDLMIGTMAQESRLGHWLDQTTPGPGPAYGPYQMEAATHDDIWSNFLKYKEKLCDKVSWTSLSTAFHVDGATEMQGNWYYATAMCRVHYYRVIEPLPQLNDIDGYAHYWKRYYNTIQGKGTVKEFKRNWKELIVNG